MESASETDRVRAVIEDWANALRNKDADRVMSHIAQDVVHFSLAPPLVSDELNGSGLQKWFDSWQGPLGYEFRELAIMAGDTVAFCHCLNRLSGTLTTGEKSDMWLRHTLGFRKIDGQWKIAHAHESVPFCMDGSYKAAIDLKP